MATTNDMEHITFSPKQTEKIGEKFAKSLKSNFLTPVTISLEGELGGGKTTFVKGFARGLGVKETIKSPTFVIMKKYQIATNDPKGQAYGIGKQLTTKSRKLQGFFYHFDCYRIQKAADILELGWRGIIKDPKNIIVVEWGDRIRRILPKNYIQIKFKFADKNKRKITIKT